MKRSYTRKPCINYIQVQNNGKLYIKFQRGKDWNDMADQVTSHEAANGTTKTFVIYNKQTDYGDVLISGYVYKVCVSGVTLYDWKIEKF